MDAVPVDFADYPEFTPDLDNNFSSNCVYLNVDDLSPYICCLSLSICMLNIRSCKKNFDDFMANFCDYVNTFSCIIFTETWLTEDRDKIFDIPGFYCHNLYRNQYGGGIKLYMKNCIKSRILKDFTIINNLCEILTVELILCDCKFLLMMVYHPPTPFPVKNVEFVDLFTLHLRNLIELKIPLIIAGDMNLNLLNPTNQIYIQMYIDNLFECNMRPCITKPTKVNLDNPITRFAVLDHIWISKDISSTQSFVFPINITDHFPVCMVISSPIKSQTSNTVKLRIFSARGKERFSVLLSNIQVQINAEDMNHMYENYYKQVFEAYSFSYPQVSKTLKPKQATPWMSYRLKQCIKKRKLNFINCT